MRISEIATRAGVSSATVSFVLNDRHVEQRISEKTRNKVLEVAEELGYRSNQMARAMRTGNSLMLGMLGGDTSQEPVGKMVAGALQAADEQGYTLKILRDAEGSSAQQVIRRCSELRLMGVIALHLPFATLSELHTEARRYGYPLVLMDARSDTPEMTQVVSDDEAGIAAGVELLVKLGHSRIAFISGQASSTLSALRENAFVGAMHHHNLDLPAHCVTRGDYYLREPSIEVARALLELPPSQRPTAILCSGDLIAMATLQVAHERGLSVPRDVSVIGFANMGVSNFAIPQLTTIEQPFMDMGRTAVNLLLEIAGQQDSAKSGQAVLAQRKSIDIREGSVREGSVAFSTDESSGPVRSSLVNSSTRLEAPNRNIHLLPTRLVERASTAPPLPVTF